MPKTYSSRDIQRKYREIFDEAKSSDSPVVVLTNNKPDVAIISIKRYDYLVNKARAGVLKDAIDSVDVYKKEKASKKLKKLDSLAELM